MLGLPQSTNAGKGLFRKAELNEGPGASSPDRDEDVELVLLSRADVEEKIRNGDIQDGKTLSAWLLAGKWLGKW